MEYNEKDIIFEGHEKRVCSTEDPDKVILYFKDTITAFNSIKKASIVNKGVVNCAISSMIMSYLNANGVSTHFLSRKGEREQLCRRIEVIPVELIVYNYFAGELASRIGMAPGTQSRTPIFDMHYNNDILSDPVVNDTEVIAMGLLTPEEIDYIYQTASRTNALLGDVFSKAGIKLVSFKLEFGRDAEGRLIVSDEISPDTCRLWDAATDEKLDKDRFREDKGFIVAHYEEVLERIQKVLE